MTLGELIARLEQESPDTVLGKGLANAHAYRGHSDQLAFEPRVNVSAELMLHDAIDCVDERVGGNDFMTHDTPVWIANVGELGKELTHQLLNEMLESWERA